MSKFLITIDSACDCNIEELTKNNIPTISFKYHDDKNEYIDDMNKENLKNFYIQMKEGVVFKTSQINPEEYYSFFNKLTSYNLPIIHISLGSGVSNTISSATIAAEQIMQENPQIKIHIIDTKLASLGSVLILNKLIEFNKNDINYEQAINDIYSYVEGLNAYYTTNTLTYFARGGRLSKVEAFLGNALKINPILDCDPDGKLRVVEKVRGSKKALDSLILRIKNQVEDANKQTVLICHADNEVGAINLGERLIKEVGFKNYKTYIMGPIIGAHTGPGLVAAFFFGKKRSSKVTSLASIKQVESELKTYLDK